MILNLLATALVLAILGVVLLLIAYLVTKYQRRIWNELTYIRRNSAMQLQER